MNSTDSSVQCQGEYGLSYIGFPKYLGQIYHKSTSCSSASIQTNHQTIVDDDYDTSISSSVDTCSQSNCQHITCCEIESCEEEVFAVTQCPKEATGGSTDIKEEPEIEYKGKDLTNYLGMLHCVSSSIAEHKVCEFYLNQTTKFYRLLIYSNDLINIFFILGINNKPNDITFSTNKFFHEKSSRYRENTNESKSFRKTSGKTFDCIR